MRNIKKPEIILTDSQKEEVKRLFKELPEKDLTLLNLTQLVFKNDKLNGQSVEGRCLKAFMGSEGFQFGTRTHEKKGDKELTIEQKKKLDANVAAYIKKDIGQLELTKIIFEDESLTTLSQESRTVVNYLNAAIDKMDSEEFKKLTFNGNFGDDATDEYKPPKSLIQTLARINKYVVGEDWKIDSLKSDQRKKAESLQKYLNTFRIKYEISSYPKESQREVFEDAFVRYTYDKVNLEQEHLDMFCSLASERVNEVNIKAQINLMVLAMEAQNADTEGRKIAMGLVEAINSARTELNQCMTRQDKMYKNLVTQRSKEIEKKESENATMLDLVIPWQQEDFRRATIHLAIKEKEKLRDEIKKLSSMSELKGMIRGLSASEIDASFEDQ